MLLTQQTVSGKQMNSRAERNQHLKCTLMFLSSYNNIRLQCGLVFILWMKSSELFGTTRHIQNAKVQVTHVETEYSVTDFTIPVLLVQGGPQKSSPGP
jgi:hypothetical protein